MIRVTHLSGFLLTVCLAACGGPLKYTVQSTAKAPGADAQVVADVKKDQSVTLLEVTVTNLAPPDRVTAGAKHFAIWWRKNDGATWSRVGNLKYSEGDHKGQLTGSVPEISFDLEASAEGSEEPASPSSDVVFAQRVN